HTINQLSTCCVRTSATIYPDASSGADHAPADCASLSGESFSSDTPLSKAFVSDFHRLSLATTNSGRDQNARANRTAHRHYRLSMWFPISLPFFSPYPAGNRLYSARDPPSLLAAEHGGKVSAFPGASARSSTMWVLHPL